MKERYYILEETIYVQETAIHPFQRKKRAASKKGCFLIDYYRLFNKTPSIFWTRYGV